MRPVATIASHPSAAAGSVSNRAATSSAASRNAASGDGAFSPAATDRVDGPSGIERRAHASEELDELLVRRRAYPDFRTEFAQPERECRERFDVPSRAPGRQQDAHVA